MLNINFFEIINIRRNFKRFSTPHGSYRELLCRFCAQKSLEEKKKKTLESLGHQLPPQNEPDVLYLLLELTQSRAG